MSVHLRIMQVKCCLINRNELCFVFKKIISCFTIRWFNNENDCVEGEDSNDNDYSVGNFVEIRLLRIRFHRLGVRSRRSLISYIQTMKN